MKRPRTSVSPAIALIGNSAMSADLPKPEALNVEIEIEVEDEPSEVVQNEDGSISFIDEDDDAPDLDAGDHYQNLADVLPEDVVRKLAETLIEKIERDKEAWKPRDEQYADAIKRTGIGEDAPGGADFAGASKVTHPVIAEGAVDYAASMTRELLPPEGPVRSKVLGTTTPDKVARGERLSRHMNDQLTRQSPEFRHDLEQLWTQQPLSGTVYLKTYWLSEENRPTCELIFGDQLLLPATASNFHTAVRRTHVMELSQADIEDRIESGMYCDVQLGPASMPDEATKPKEATDKVTGVTQDPENTDDIRTVYEVYIKHRLTEDPACEGKRAPYIVTIDEETHKVLALRRNWEAGDPQRREINWIIPWGMIPWRGARSIGIFDLVAGLSKAATGSLRALLDSAQIDNFPSGLILKGASVGGQSLTVNPTEFIEIDAAGMTDVRQVVMPLPFKGPSATLFQLLQWLTDAAKGVVRTSMDDLPADQISANTPVGTQLSRVEQGLKVFSSIHSRQHESMRLLLEHLYTLNRLYWSEEEGIEETGEPLAFKSDYLGPCDVAPVSDPAIFSDLQRLSQAQSVKQLSLQSTPGMFDEREVNVTLLKAMKVPDIDRLMPPPKKPNPMNPAAENVAMTMGTPAAAFPEQDHAAHLSVHVDFLDAVAKNPLMAPGLIDQLLHHVRDHVALWYGNAMKNAVEDAAQISLDQDDPSPQAQIALAQTLAAASPSVLAALAQPLAQMMPAIEPAMQMAQRLSASMQPPADPAVKAQMAEVERRAKDDEGKLAVAQQKLQIDQAKLTVQQQTAAAKSAADLQRTHMQTEAMLEANAQDNETALAVAASHPRMTNGNGITNPGV
jgi:hypothetical protein